MPQLGRRADHLPLRLRHGPAYNEDVFDFAAHRRTDAYGLIVERTGAERPPD